MLKSETLPGPTINRDSGLSKLPRTQLGERLVAGVALQLGDIAPGQAVVGSLGARRGRRSAGLLKLLKLGGGGILARGEPALLREVVDDLGRIAPALNRLLREAEQFGRQLLHEPVAGVAEVFQLARAGGAIEGGGLEVVG